MSLVTAAAPLIHCTKPEHTLKTHTVIHARKHQDGATAAICLRHGRIALSEGSAFCSGREAERFWRADRDEAGMLIHCCHLCFI